MAYIRYIRDEDASPELRELYDQYRSPGGHMDNILRIHGPNPPSLEGHYRLCETLMRGLSGLSTSRREMIAVVVSAINECHY